MLSRRIPLYSPRTLSMLTTRQIHTPGFNVSAINANLRKGKNRLDLSLVVSEEPCKVAGVFTQNIMRAPPVVLSEQIIKSQDNVQAIVINAGCANACTGDEGMEDAKTMVNTVKQATGANAIVMSTGVIGLRLPMPAIVSGIEQAAKELTPEGWEDVSRAVMTTDTYPKLIHFQKEIDGKTVTLTGFAKGSGMIHPNMATMLSLLTTDANISKELLEQALRYVIIDRYIYIYIYMYSSP